MQPNIEVLVHLIADAIVHNECGAIYSSRELRQLATNLIVTENPEMILRKAIDQAVRVSPLRALRCPLIAILVKHHNVMTRAQAA